MQRVVTIFYYLMMAISAVIFLLYYVGPTVPGTEGTSLSEPVVTSLSLMYAFVVLIIALLLAILFPVINAIRDPKNVGRSIVVFIACLVVLGGCYYFASGEILDIPGYSGSDNNRITLKIVDTGLFAMYLTFVAVLVSIVYAEVRRYFL
jgi:protein-S-isoprenylcysteine O-methyltransferase Ste14